MPNEALRVGELAKRTGLTVRALHHYDEIGLLRPSLHSDKGYRLYVAADIARLQRIVSLRQLGFSLDEVRACLAGTEFPAARVVRMHLDRLRDQLAVQQRLCDRLEAIEAHLRSAEEVSVDEFLQMIEAIAMSEKYFTSEQQTAIKNRRDELGDEVLRQRQEEWAELIAQIRAAMESGADPASDCVQLLSKRWLAKVHETTGGDAAIEQAIERLWEEQGDALAAQHGSQYDPRPVMGYITRAIEAANAK